MSAVGLVRRHPLVAFFVLAYLLFVVALMAIGVSVAVAGTLPAVVMSVLAAVASWAPNAAAAITARAADGPGAVGRLASGWLRWRVGIGWYAFALAPLAVMVAIALVARAAGAPAPEGTLGSPDAVGWVLLVFFNIVQGATGEELGWRGFALSRLQARYSRLVAAIALGLLISAWHSILHLIDPKPVPEWQFWFMLTCYSVVIAWAYNRTRGSLLIASLFHFSFNVGFALLGDGGLGLVALGPLFWGLVPVSGLAAVAVVLIEGRSYWLSSDREADTASSRPPSTATVARSAVSARSPFRQSER
jgi:membrane protease YdiL (CAAX protease family)